MKNRIDEHIEFHETISEALEGKILFHSMHDKHKSDAAFLKKVKARIEDLESALAETFEQVYDNPHIDALIDRVL